MWPAQAPVENPEKRASVSTATRLPKSRYFRAVVTWAISSMPVPRGPQLSSTITSPAFIRCALRAATAARSVVKIFAGPVCR